MNDRLRVLLAVSATVLLFLGVQFGALALIEPFHDSERQAVENPDDPTNSAIYFAIILVATGLMLAAFKYDAERLIRGLIIAVSGMLAWFVFTELLPPIFTIGSLNSLALVGAVGVSAALFLYPEWYIIDIAGVLMGAGAAGLFGISFGLLPAIIFLVVLAVYDAISVYKTEHMLDLADGVMDLKIPVIFVIPTTFPYSFLESDAAVDSAKDGGDDVSANSSKAAIREETHSSVDAETNQAGSGEIGANDDNHEGESDRRDALFIGLGDAVIPTILVASAAFFVDAGTIDVPIISLNYPSLGAILGTNIGLLILMYMVLQGRPHAGLPLLNGGAIGGYLLGALASGVSIAAALGL